jgi:protein TonB
MLNQNIFFLEDPSNGIKPKVSVLLPPTEISAKQDVFAEAMLEGSSTRQKRHPLKWAASLGAHVSVLIILLFMPLYFSQGLNLQRLNATLLVAPLPPSAAPPPPPAAAAAPRVARVTPKTFTPGKLTAPSYVPRAVVATPDAAPPAEALAAMPGGISGGMPGGQVGGILGGTMNGAPAPAAPVVAQASKEPVRVGGDVRAPRLISGPAPVYPVLARQGRIQGIVVIEAIIDEHGNVVQEKLISGHPLLVPAAMKALMQRKYEPTILDGQPTSVDLRVEITFHMD